MGLLSDVQEPPDYKKTMRVRSYTYEPINREEQRNGLHPYSCQRLRIVNGLHFQLNPVDMDLKRHCVPKKYLNRGKPLEL